MTVPLVERTITVPITTEQITASSAEPQADIPSDSAWQRFLRGNTEDQRWVRPALLALLLGTAVLYIWGLGASGWANSFYSAAVQAGTMSWKAMFFGSSDAANFITVDKPPASLWLMELSTRMFGVHSWSILVPQALAGVASVGVLYLAVRRWFGAVAGLVAGLVLALTPVAVLMFRFNNPDALLVLLMVAAAYAVTRAIEAVSVRWLMFAGVLIGFAFLTKMLQAYLVLPGFALAYLVAADTALRRRLIHLVLAGVAVFVSSFWWVAVVELWPASSRPYIGGSQNNSIVELILGYNGLGRITGNEVGSVGGGGMGGPGGGSMWGQTGLGRMFGTDIGGQISWLLPAALILLAALTAATFRAKRTDKTRAAMIIWGGWLLVTMLIFSFMSGIFHQYYTVALAPAIGALVGIGTTWLWQRREMWAHAVLAGTVFVTGMWSVVLLSRSGSFLPWLRPLVAMVALIAAAAVVAHAKLRASGEQSVADPTIDYAAMYPPPVLDAYGQPLPANPVPTAQANSSFASLSAADRARYTRIAGMTAIGGMLFAGLAGATAYAVDTAATAHQGSIVTAGPQVAGGMGGPGGMRGGFGQNGGTNGTNPFSNGTQGGTGSQGGQGFTPPGMGSQGSSSQGGSSNSFGGMGGGAGGLLNGSTPSDQVLATISENASNYTWVLATVGSQNASGYQLGSGHPVMSIGGFNGSDPAPSLEQFKQYVSEGKIHYFVAGGMGGPGGFGQNGGTNPFGNGAQGGNSNGFGAMGSGSQVSSEISEWVEANFTKVTVDGTTLYDLTKPLSSSTDTGATNI